MVSMWIRGMLSTRNTHAYLHDMDFEKEHNSGNEKVEMLGILSFHPPYWSAPFRITTIRAKLTISSSTCS